MVNLKEEARKFSPTEKVYLENSYLKEINANLLSILMESKNKAYLVFDKTIFHPKSGGQESDTGTIYDNERLFEVKKVLEVDGVVFHYANIQKNSGIPEKGEIFRLKLDWERRYKIMRSHTAGHILDYAVMKVTGKKVNTIEANHASIGSYIKYEHINLSPIQLEMIEKTANEAVKAGISVNVRYVKREELEKFVFNAPNLERLPDVGIYRIVEIQNINSIPCSGTHVKNTSEINYIKIKGVKEEDDGTVIFYETIP
ncbi:alanyl-tRNA editing protein [Fervidicoccus fontis]|uniref:Alanyl-transfer RNA synthetases family profile domain-containing protein n=1 Tax=Fervidicoccus fontis TaxID=683846 RepID=A0A7C2ZB22_9CREN|nr:alanyl-tRNA editing protein [Fervidicoccus fontis]PMB78032.1 MAG: hypothetical protein C0177_01580 [Fervidicoccus fontis]HEW64455.1 hypothetical protein [Fervidicoccus fontis]